MTIEICSEPALWDAFVEGSPAASNYHRWAWRGAIEETYGHKPYYLAAVEKGVVEGVLPLFHLRSRLFGDSLVSVPFFSYGGIVGRTAEASEQLLRAATALADRLHVPRIELRQRLPLCGVSGEACNKVTMEIPLPVDAADLWNSLTTGMRNKIRQGQKQGFRVEWGGLDAIDPFYAVFAENMRNLGTPVYPKRWFQNLWRCSPDSVRVMMLWDDSVPVAGAFLVGYRDTLELPWSASLPAVRKRYAPLLMYWTFLEWAIGQGFRKMDLGRCTPGGGTYEFKRHWKCEETPLEWHYWSADGKARAAAAPTVDKFRLAVRVWKHLPLPIANGLGPLIVRSIP